MEYHCYKKVILYTETHFFLFQGRAKKCRPCVRSAKYRQLVNSWRCRSSSSSWKGWSCRRKKYRRTCGAGSATRPVHGTSSRLATSTAYGQTRSPKMNPAHYCVVDPARLDPEFFGMVRCEIIFLDPRPDTTIGDWIFLESFLFFHKKMSQGLSWIKFFSQNWSQFLHLDLDSAT